MRSIPDIGIHPFLSRHTPESRFTHWILTNEELLQRIRDAWVFHKPGYRDGVYEIPLNPDGFFSPVVVLKPGDRLRGIYEARTEGEDPRKVTVLDKGDRQKTPAVGVTAILYHKDVLAEDGETFDHDWAVLSINARITVEPEPMTVGTLLANHFHVSGGTNTGMTPEEFEAALRTSYMYWKDKAFLG